MFNGSGARYPQRQLLTAAPANAVALQLGEKRAIGLASTGTYKGIYAMHKYWGKKPFDQISSFIERFSSEGDLVLDSFCGSGVTLIEALKANRRAIGIDLNPIALLLAKVSTTPIDVLQLKTAFAQIEDQVKDTITKLYTLDADGEQQIVTHTVWQNKTPVEVWYSTPSERKKVRAGNSIDLQMANHPTESPKWYPDATLFENARINVHANQKVSDLFTHRALVALSLIWAEIVNIENEDIRDVLKLTFTGTLSQASNLVFVIRRRSKTKNLPPRAEVGSWVIGYWVPEEHFEINAWNCFENRFKRILKGEKEVNELFGTTCSGPGDDDIQLIQGSATKLSMSNASVDYVFIDPPHTNRILYLEQSLMWNSWLGLDESIDWEDELVVSSSAKRRDKDLENYKRLLETALSEITRVLKPNKQCSIAFNSLKDNDWISLLESCFKAGLELQEVMPLEYSATSVVQDNRKNALKTDFILTFVNSHRDNTYSIEICSDRSKLDRFVQEQVTKHQLTEMYKIINAIMVRTLPEGFMFRISEIIESASALLKELLEEKH